MKNSILNYQFFKSYRLPIDKNDKILINIEIPKLRRTIRNLKIESINLSGLNFVSPVKIKIGEKIDIKVKSNKIFHKWDFSLKGTIVRSFISESNIDQIVYGVLLDKQGDIDVLNYFLKDYISRLNKSDIKNHLFLASTLNRKLHVTEGVELFSLFFSIIEDIFNESPKELLNDLAEAFKSKYYSIHIINEDNDKLEYSRSNFQSIDKIMQPNENILLSLNNNSLINYNEKTEIEEDVIDDEKIYNSISYPISNRLQKSIGVITIYNTVDMKPFKTSQETSLKLLCQIFSHYFEDYYSKVKKNKKTLKTYDNFLGQNRINVELKSSLDIIRSTKKNILVSGEDGTKKNEIIEYVLEGKNDKHNNVITFDFRTYDKINEIFENIDNIDVKVNSILWLKEVYKLSHEKQSRLFEFITNSNMQVYTESSIELSHHVKAGKILKKLYFLIAQLYIHLIPLRNRQNDLIEIANEILKEELLLRELPLKKYSKSSMDKIISYNWPGNLKELRTEIRKSILRSYNDEEIILNIQIDQRDEPKKNKALYQLLASTTCLHDQSISYENHVSEFKKYFKKKESA